ncbi:LysR family transcriptional regulator [Mycolicibacterium murale]|jgi:DNA-binding transcriptional LysR family regulator
MMLSMHLTHILRADLNLIPVLAALLDERHVSRAAGRLGMSQPATSRALQRLRSLLGDPLLIRERDGYRLTARAQILHTQLGTVLPALEALVSPDSFEPAGSTTPVQLVGTDFAVRRFGPAICRRLGADAPQAPVRFHSWRYDTMADQIRSGNVDLGLFGGFAPDDLSVGELLTERFVCVVDVDHPAAGSEFTLRDYLRQRHLVIDVAEGRQPDVDLPLRALGAQRRAAVVVPYHLAVPALLAGTDLVATVPITLAQGWPQLYPVRLLGAPVQVRELEYRMIWHRAYDDDRRHRWLRSVVRDAVALSAPTAPP